MILSSSRRVFCLVRRCCPLSVASTTSVRCHTSSHDNNNNRKKNSTTTSATTDVNKSLPFPNDNNITMTAKKNDNDDNKDEFAFRPERPRKIKVKRGSGNCILDSKSVMTKDSEIADPSLTIQQQQQQQQSPLSLDLGRLIVRPRTRAITDRNQQTILSFDRHDSTSQRQGVTKTELPSLSLHSNHLPTLHAAALLDTRNYCIHSANAATTKSGTDASLRMIRGKKDFVTLLRKLVGRQKNTTTTASMPQQQQSYILSGHGIPHQLLQDHVDLACTLLQEQQDSRLERRNRRSRCTIQLLSNTAELTKDSSNTNHYYQVDWMQVRRRGTSKSTTTSTETMPVPDAHQDRLHLYLAAMQRLARHLGSVVAPTSQLPSNTTRQSFPRWPSAWKATFGYGNADTSWDLVPQQLPLSSSLPSSSSRPLILVHWSGSICRLLVRGAMVVPDASSRGMTADTNDNGKPQNLRRRRLSRPQPVALSFEAVF